MNKPTLILIGGSGFIGRHLAADFHQRGWRILMVSRDPNRARDSLGSQYEYINSLKHLYPSIEIDLLINLAGASVGEGKWSPQRKQALLDSRLQPTRELGAWLQQREHNRPKMIIQASAVGYYGNGSQAGWPVCDENSPPQAVFVSELCRQWEQAAQENQRSSGIPTAVCRLGVVLGRGGGILPQLLKPVSFGLGRIGSGRQPLTWIHMADVIGAMRFLSSQTAPPAWQVYNFTAPESCSQLAFAQAAARLMHRPLLFAMPEKAMRWMLGEQADLVLDGQYVQPHALQQAGYAFEFPAIGPALADLLARDK